jgi:prevent-host-death family protein
MVKKKQSLVMEEIVMEETIPISKFKATCLSLLDQVKKTGRPIIVTKKGEPIAQVIAPPVPKKKANWLGSFKSTGRITGDIISPVLDEKGWEVLKG